jgi:hypothetical protein
LITWAITLLRSVVKLLSMVLPYCFGSSAQANPGAMFD